MKYYLAFALVCFLTTTRCQTIGYDGFIKQADSLYKLKQFKASAEAFSKAFNSNGGRGRFDHRINAARSWTLAQFPDSAYFNLERVVRTGQFMDFDKLNSEPDFQSLHKQKRWKDLIVKVKTLHDQHRINFNRPLAAKLDSIYDSDQYWRLKMDSIISQKGTESPEFQTVAQKMYEVDSLNLKSVTSILDKYGWLGSDVVGGKGNSALFLVIQHAQLPSQLRYLPILREAVKNGKAQANDLALLEDRVALRKGGLQIYGSQIGTNMKTGKKYVLPLEDPVNVDKRRASVGLAPISVYARLFGITWSIEQYEKDISESKTR